MIQLKESIHLPMPVDQVFGYVTDFSHIQDWDPGVVSSIKTAAGRPGTGTTFDLVLRFGPFRPQMTYTIIAYTPNSRVVLKGRADSFMATDTIDFSATETGTRIDYQADIEFFGVQKHVKRILTPMIKSAGKKAMQGLEKRLNPHKLQSYPTTWPESGSSIVDFLADHTILPGMLMFSSLGYAISKRFWSPLNESLADQQVVLTGATSGIGKAAAFQLALKNAGLTLVARDKQKADRVTQEIIEQTGNPKIDYIVADLSLIREVKQAADQLMHQKKTIDVLINNAGALFNERRDTGEGFEQTFATNLLGVFHLTQCLKPALIESAQAKGRARIINVSSGGMYTQKIKLSDLQNREGPFDGAKAYARAKRGMVILTKLWARELAEKGVAVHAMHPGWVDTPGIRTSLPRFHARLRPILRTPLQGADTIVWLAVSPEARESTGMFWLDRRPHETVVFPQTGESEKQRYQLLAMLTDLTA